MKDSIRRGKADDWLNAAYAQLIEGGVDSVKILPLAKTLNTSRTSFYWFFEDREALLEALLQRWKHNTEGLIGQAERYADSIVEAMLNVFDCWLDEALFDAELEFAVRHWAMQCPTVARQVAAADQQRLDALTRMLEHHGDAPPLAQVRARTTYLTQIGYISMRTQEHKDERIGRIADYVEVFTGRPCSAQELRRFAARHADRLDAWMAADRQRRGDASLASSR